MTSKSGFRIFLSPPHMGGTEEKYLLDAFKSNWIAPIGPYLSRFETSVQEYLGKGYTVAVSSGTAALHLALRLCGLKADELVICPSLTFIASASPIVHMGGVPVFIDCADNDVNISAVELKKSIVELKKLGKKPKGVIVVHLYGFPAPLDEILDVCREEDMWIIEDAAESLGSKYKDQLTGTFGDIGVFSFNGNKVITTSGGGMLWAADASKADKARYFATQAREPVLHYEHQEIGYNYRMSNLLAALGVGQMEYLQAHIENRRRINKLYRDLLSECDEVWFPNEGEGTYANMWLTVMFMPNNVGSSHRRDFIISELFKKGIEARPVWKPLHVQPALKRSLYIGNRNCLNRFESGICLPSGSAMTDDQVYEVAQIVIGAYNRGS